MTGRSRRSHIWNAWLRARSGALNRTKFGEPPHSKFANRVENRVGNRADVLPSRVEAAIAHGVRRDRDLPFAQADRRHFRDSLFLFFNLGEIIGFLDRPLNFSRRLDCFGILLAVVVYTTWRDTRTALIIFNRNQDFTSVIKEAQRAMKDHQHYKSGPTKETETRFRYIFTHPEDKRRDIIATLMLFNMPKPVKT
jgi:hypothetical protein